MLHLSNPLQEGKIGRFFPLEKRHNSALRSELDRKDKELRIISDELNTTQLELNVLKKQHGYIQKELEKKVASEQSKRFHLEMREDKLKKQNEKLKKQNEEQGTESLNFTNLLRKERINSHRDLQANLTIFQDEIMKKEEEAEYLRKLAQFISSVSATKMEAYHAAYAEIGNIIWSIIGRYGKLKELEDEGATWVSDYCHEISQHMEQTRLKLRASCKEADSQEKPKRKEGPKSEEAEPLKPKFEPVPPHNLTTAETAMRLSEGFSYYDVLGVTQSATTQDITKAYRKIVLKWHPDKGHVHEVSDDKGHVHEISDEDAREAFILINQAYEILKNTELRAKYDAYCKSQESGSQTTHKPFRPDMFFPGFKFDDPYKTFARFGTDSSPNFLRTRRTGSTTPSQ